jgi:hypothetical protein
MSTTAEEVSANIAQDAPLVESAATAASIATGQPEIAALTTTALTLAQAIAQIIASEQTPKPASQAEWAAMGTALGAALKAYDAAK